MLFNCNKKNDYHNINQRIIKELIMDFEVQYVAVSLVGLAIPF